MRAVVLADGPRNEAAPLTLDLPTAALPVAGKPVVSWMLDYLERQGVSSAVVTCSRSPFLVERAVERHNGRLPIKFALAGGRGIEPSALAELVPQGDLGFVVLVGNMLTDLNLREAMEQHRRSGALVTIVVTEQEGPCPFGEVVLDRTNSVVMVGSEQLVRRRGSRIGNTGIYIMQSEVLQHIPQPAGEDGFDLARDLLPHLLDLDLPVSASMQRGFWSPINSHEQYRVASLALLSGQIRGMQPDGRQVSPGIWIDEQASIDPRATLEPPVIVGKGCRVDRDAVIGPCAVLGDDVRVKRGGVVRRAVVLPGSTVGLATRLEDAVVRGNVLARPTSTEPTYIDDRHVLEPLEHNDGQPLIRSILDRLLALTAMLVLAPLILLIAIAIKLDSAGPVFFSQLRVGQGRRSPAGQYQGRVFELLKFRTMTDGADRRLAELMASNEYGASPFVKIKEDTRITRVGAFLRATSLDELPQFVNVLKGEMALVGNRPLPLYEAEQLADDWQRLRFNAPAGLTGLWQVSGRSDLSAEERIVLDNYYALTHSYWSDLKILLVTIPTLLARRGAR